MGTLPGKHLISYPYGHIYYNCHAYVPAHNITWQRIHAESAIVPGSGHTYLHINVLVRCVCGGWVSKALPNDPVIVCKTCL